MKKFRVLGILLIVLAAAVLALGIFVNNTKDGDGTFAADLKAAREVVVQVENNAKAVKNAASAEKKAATAQDKIVSAGEAAAQAIADADAMDAALQSGETGEADVDALRAALAQLTEGSEGVRASVDAAEQMSALVDQLRGASAEESEIVTGAPSDAMTQLDEGVAAVALMTDEKTLALYQAFVSDAYDAVSAAETAIAGVHESMVKVYGLAGAETPEAVETPLTEEPVCVTIEECHDALAALQTQAAALTAYSDSVSVWAQSAVSAAAEASKLQVSVKDSVVIMLADNFIGVVFTAILLAIAGLVLMFLTEQFRRQWRRNPVFSVFIALVVMLVLQTYALGFRQATFIEWARFWFENTFNVLRANASVGIIALGMTLIIITGGIDLAVGSTLAGVGTVLMVLLDTGDRGLLMKLGITGIPAYAVAIVISLIAGVGIGALIGMLVTKGRIPPFIVTLGIMNVVRSVAQYCTKSYNPTIPKGFEAIANTVVLGQRPMTIIYWLVLAVFFYLLMKHTAFGRHVYAVGSNERTTRLSGINVDRVKMKVYMLGGFVVAVAAVTQLSRLGGMDVASAGSGYELDAIAAVVVGGTAMSGGRGSIVGTVLGVLIIGIMNNLLILLGVDSFLTDAFKGAIVVAAVLMQRKERS